MTDMQGIERYWLETLLDELPLPAVLIEASAGTVTFANFTAAGRRLMNDELPSTRP